MDTNARAQKGLSIAHHAVDESLFMWGFMLACVGLCELAFVIHPLLGGVFLPFIGIFVLKICNAGCRQRIRIQHAALRHAVHVEGLFSKLPRGIRSGFSPGMYALCWLPEITLWVLNLSKGHVRGLGRALGREIAVVHFPTRLPRYRIIEAGESLDLATGTILGSRHAELESQFRRRPYQKEAIRRLQANVPGGILVSGQRRQVILSLKGEIIDVRSIREA